MAEAVTVVVRLPQSLSKEGGKRGYLQLDRDVGIAIEGIAGTFCFTAQQNVPPQVG